MMQIKNSISYLVLFNCNFQSFNFICCFHVYFFFYFSIFLIKNKVNWNKPVMKEKKKCFEPRETLSFIFLTVAHHKNVINMVLLLFLTFFSFLNLYTFLCFLQFLPNYTFTCIYILSFFYKYVERDPFFPLLLW